MDDEGEDDEKDLIADEIFTGDGDGEVEEGEAVERRHPGDDEEEEDEEESGRNQNKLGRSLYYFFTVFLIGLLF